MYLTCHSIAPLQSHPFTISSIPEDGKLEFLIRAQKGGTKRFLDYASKHDHIHTDTPGTGTGLGDAAAVGKLKPRTVFLEGPYGTLRPLSQFDSVILIAGGMGVTFTMPLLRDLVARWKKNGGRQAVTRRIRVIWAIRSRAHLGWFETQLRSVLGDVGHCGRAEPGLIREVELGVYVTCEADIAEEPLPTPLLLSDRHQALPISSEQETGIELVLNDSNEKTSPTTNKEEILSTTPIKLEPYPSSNRDCHCTTTIDEDRGQAQPEHTSLQPPKIPLISRRPDIRPIIRKVLEKAEGESAVVVCGPERLAEDVRRSVVYLSDERAVHKGTGAQGVYLHVEGFGW
jgi:NAD(P)H-flavin reductase